MPAGKAGKWGTIEEGKDEKKKKTEATLLFAVISRLTMTPVFDKRGGRKGKRDEQATEVTDDAAAYCKW